MKALILDMEEDILDLVGYILTKTGFEVVALSEEADLVPFASDFHPALVIIGHFWEAETQYELCRNLRALPYPMGKSPLIACLTTDPSRCGMKGFYGAGADVCWVMPIKPAEMIETLQDLLPINTEKA